MLLQEEDLDTIKRAAELNAPYSGSAANIIAYAMYETATYHPGYGAQAYKDWLASFTALG